MSFDSRVKSALFKKSVKLVAIAFSLSVIAIGFYVGRNIPFAEQWPLYEALRTISSIIFAVVGAWLAIIFPERLRLSFQNDKSAPEVKEGQGVSKLFTPVVNSTVILCIVLLVGVLAPIVKRLDFLSLYVFEIRGLSYGMLASLTLWQLWTVILTLVPADMVKTLADKEDGHRQRIGRLTKNARFQERPVIDEDQNNPDVR